MNKIQKFVYVTLNDEVRAKLSEDLSVRVTSENLLFGLMQASGLELSELAEMDWNYALIKDVYSRSSSFRSSELVYDVITFEESIVPEGTEQSLYEEQIKHKGEVWHIHKNDVDPFPSTPHAHNYDCNLTLHLGNGELYHGRKLVNKIKYKDLKNLRNKVKNIELPKLEI